MGKPGSRAGNIVHMPRKAKRAAADRKIGELNAGFDHLAQRVADIEAAVGIQILPDEEERVDAVPAITEDASTEECARTSADGSEYGEPNFELNPDVPLSLRTIIKVVAAHDRLLFQEPDEEGANGGILAAVQALNEIASRTVPKVEGNHIGLLHCISALDLLRCHLPPGHLLRMMTDDQFIEAVERHAAEKHAQERLKPADWEKPQENGEQDDRRDPATPPT